MTNDIRENLHNNDQMLVLMFIISLPSLVSANLTIFWLLIWITNNRTSIMFRRITPL